MHLRKLQGRDTCTRDAALPMASATAYERSMRCGPIQHFVAVVLAVSLTAMGVAAASARGQTVVNGQFTVLCAGDGLVQIALDADGNPTGESHLCPDLAAGLLGVFRLVLPEVSRPEGLAESLVPVPARFPSFARRAISRARGPPLSS